MVDRNDTSMDLSVPCHAIGVSGKIEEAAGLCKNSSDYNTYDFVVNGLFAHSILGSRVAGHRNS